jgi:hypothetical protein
MTKLTDTELAALIEKENHELFIKGEKPCQCCYKQIATVSEYREGWHEDENGNQVTEEWHEYFCDKCYPDCTWKEEEDV